VRPIDLQGMVTRTQEIERLQRIQQQHPVLAQEQFSERLRKEAEENEKRVRSAQESFPARIQDEKRDRSQDRGGSGAGRDREDKSETADGRPEAAADDSAKGRHIDVKA
jgi:hypothetical protein